MANAYSIYKRVMKNLGGEEKFKEESQALILAACIIAEAIRNKSEEPNGDR